MNQFFGNYRVRLVSMNVGACRISLRALAIVSLMATAARGQDWKPTRIVAPEYSCLALKAKIHGSAQVNVTIGESGRPAGVTAIFGHPLLLAEAIDSARKWRFQRLRHTGESQGTFTINYSFEIQERATKGESPYVHTWDLQQPEIVIELPNRVIVSAISDPRISCKSPPLE
jgi:TonB family protein